MNMKTMGDMEKLLWRVFFVIVAAGAIFLISDHWHLNQWKASTEANRYTDQDAQRDWEKMNVKCDEIMRRLNSLELRRED